jgi:hypothetical protein
MCSELETLLKEKNSLEDKQMYLRNRHSKLKQSDFSCREEFKKAQGELQSQLDQITKQKAHVEIRYTRLFHEHIISTTKSFIKENSTLLVFEIDNARIPINENLEVEVSFSPCKHTQKLSLCAFIPFERQRLWEDVIKEGLMVTQRLNCEKCRTERESMKAKLGFIREAPSGHLMWKIRALH